MIEAQWIGVISAAIRDALDSRGIELTWSDTDAAAENVLVEIRLTKERP